MSHRLFPRLAVTVLLSLSLAPLSRSDERPAMKWGDVPLEHLRMTTFPSDTNANAVILFDHGEGTFNSTYELTFTRHTRIKILKRAGFEMGNVVLSYYGGKDAERITGVEGMTIALGPDGEPVETELEDDAIFEERATGDWVRIRFSMPALSEGCVIEYRYKRTAEVPWYLPDWDFQTTEPVLWSEYQVASPEVFQFVVVKYGAESYAINDARREKRPFLGAGGGGIADMQILHFAMANVPALRSEPYITTLDDYRCKLDVQLAAVTWPGEPTRKILNTWPSLMDELLKDAHIRGALDGTRRSRSLAHDLTDALPMPRQKLTAIYDHIRNTILWDGTNEFVTERDLDDVLESKQGNAAEINLLLVSMLRTAGLDATPVLLSTRGHGKIQKLWPIVSNFNYLIARIKAGGETFLVDATDRQRPLTVLPTRALNHDGLLLQPGTEVWIPIQPGMKSRESTVVTAVLAADGSLTGLMEKGFADYRAFDQRVALGGKKDEDYLKSLLKTETTGFASDSFYVHNRDSCALPLEVHARISSSSAGQVLQEFIYVNPMLFERTMESPFKRETRNFPVDFPYGVTTTYKLDLQVPEGYSVKEIPSDFSTVLPLNAGSYSRASSLSGNVLSVLVRFDLSQPYIEARMYKSLRQMYQEIVTRESELVILARNAPAPAPTPAASTKRKK